MNTDTIQSPDYLGTQYIIGIFNYCFITGLECDMGVI